MRGSYGVKEHVVRCTVYCVCVRSESFLYRVCGCVEVEYSVEEVVCVNAN